MVEMVGFLKKKKKMNSKMFLPKNIFVKNSTISTI